MKDVKLRGEQLVTLRVTDGINPSNLDAPFVNQHGFLWLNEKGTNKWRCLGDMKELDVSVDIRVSRRDGGGETIVEQCDFHL